MPSGLLTGDNSVASIVAFRKTMRSPAQSRDLNHVAENLSIPHPKFFSQVIHKDSSALR
jgi:hypothetical protein